MTPEVQLILVITYDSYLHPLGKKTCLGWVIKISCITQHIVLINYVFIKIDKT